MGARIGPARPQASADDHDQRRRGGPTSSSHSAPTLWAALLIRVVTGFFSGTLGVCQGYIADVTRPEDRPKSMGYFGAALNLGRS